MEHFVKNLNVPAEGRRQRPWMYMHASCHPEAPTWVAVNYSTGEIAIECSQCEAVIGGMQLARVDRDGECS